ncbi:hypothetical protein LTR95_012636 [Oleoguttula sp. CCFEE 5521]
MIPSSSARPRMLAPSTATLKVLYQLAYISSGTALGVGALCAEERRRRTKIVQRIADNAKRIRQSPRYSRGSHSVAAVSEVVDEGVYPWGDIENVRGAPAYAGPHLPSVVEKEYGQVAGREGKVRWRPMRPSIDEHTGRNESEALAARRAKGTLDRSQPQTYRVYDARPKGRPGGAVRRSKDSAISTVKSSGHGIEHKSLSFDTDDRNRAPGDNVPYEPGRAGTPGPLKQPSSQLSDANRTVAMNAGSTTVRVKEQPYCGKSGPCHEYQSMYRPRKPHNDLGSAERGSDDPQMAVAASASEPASTTPESETGAGTTEPEEVSPASLERSSISSTAAHRPFEHDLQGWTEANALEVNALRITTSHSLDGNEDLPYDANMPFSVEVDTFFVSARDANAAAKDMLPVCDRLLQQSLELGTAADVQSLVLWKIGENFLTIADIMTTLRDISEFVATPTHNSFIRFVESLRDTSAYTTATETQQVNFDLALRAEICKLSRQYDYPETHSVSSAFLKTLKCWQSGVDVPRLVNEHCQRLVLEEHAAAALELFRQVIRGTSSLQTADLEPVADSLFATLVERQHFSLSAGLLRLKSMSGQVTRQAKQINALVAMCSESSAHGMLAELLGRPENGTQLLATSRSLQQLSAENQVQVARAIAGNVTLARSFSTLYQLVPRKMRSLISEHDLEAVAATLKAEWKVTRNLFAVRKSYATIVAERRLSRNAKDTQTLELTMVEIYLSAGKQDLALKQLARLNTAPGHGSVGILLMLAFAKSHNWVSFQNAMGFLINDPSLVAWTKESTRVFNQVINLYAGCHSATQLSDFALHAIQELAFVPNVATFDVLLSAFVKRKDIVLTERWFRLRKQYSADPKANVTSLATTLLRKWYLDFRHSHVMVMWYCRTLLEEAKLVRSKQLLDLVLEAIGSDLRNLAGSNAPWMQKVIYQRLETVQKSLGVVPKPGVVYNKQLLHPSLPHPAPVVTGLTRQPSDSTDTGSIPSTQSFGLAPSSDPPLVVAEPSPDDPEQLQIAQSTASTTRTPVDWSAHPLEAINAPDPNVPPQAVFSELRHVYSVKPQTPGNPSAATSARRLHPERAMMLAFSLCDYQTVLDIYESSRDAVGLPISPIALEQALEASIRLHNATHQAEAILASARAAGMNTSLCTAPLLIHQLRTKPHLSRSEARHIRLTALAYYAENDARHYTISPHLGTAAAHALIKSGHATYALNLLSSIYHPDVMHHRTLDIAALSVWLLAYASLSHVPGMQWVVDTVLERNVTIDMAFLRNMKRAKRPIHYLSDGTAAYGRQAVATQARIESWRELCRERRARQMFESKVFGRKLVGLLVRDANGETDGQRLPTVKRRRVERRVEPRKRPNKRKRLATAKHTKANNEGMSTEVLVEETAVIV